MDLPGALAKSAHNNKFDGLKEYDMYLQKDKLRKQAAVPFKGCPRTSASFYSMARSYPQRTAHNNPHIGNSIYFIVVVIIKSYFNLVHHIYPHLTNVASIPEVPISINS